MTVINIGIVAGIWPCGIAVMVSELFISESLPQVFGTLHDFCASSIKTRYFGNHKVHGHILDCFLSFLELICYDDGCHLRRYARKPSRQNLTTPTTTSLSSLEIVVDKMHVKGHVDPWCLKTCDARNFKALEQVIMSYGTLCAIIDVNMYM